MSTATERTNQSGGSRRHRKSATADAPIKNLDLEEGLVAALLLHPGLWPRLESDVRPDDFADWQLQKVVSHIADYPGRNGKIDPVLLGQQMQSAGEEAIGGRLTEVVGRWLAADREIPTPSMAVEYAKQIRDLARRRVDDEFADVLKYATRNGSTDAEREEMFARWLEQRKRVAAPETSKFQFTSAVDLLAETHETKFLINGVLPVGQPGLFAGRFKTLKTSSVIDAAVSVATGTDFLGEFRIPEALPVGILSGESGRRKVASTIRRVCEARGLEREDLGNLYFCPSVPNLASDNDVGELARFVKQRSLALLVVDPAYLALSAAADSMANAPAVGGLLRRLSDMTTEAGASLALVAHARKFSDKPGDPPELGDVAHAGLAEWARWWLLLGTRKPYDAETGSHSLWMVAGGSEGHGGCWGLDVHEGRHDQVGGQVWEVSIATRSELIDGNPKRRDQDPEVRERQKLDADRSKVVAAMVKFPNGETAKKIGEHSGLSGGRVKVVLASLLADDTIEDWPVQKPDRKTPRDGYRLKESNIADAT